MAGAATPHYGYMETVMKLRLLVLACTLLAASACIVRPYDGQRTYYNDGGYHGHDDGGYRGQDDYGRRVWHE
jgi:hypothetical protein